MFNPNVDLQQFAVEREVDDKGNVIGSYHVLESVHAGEIARVILVTQFPMSRFYVVGTPRELQGALPKTRLLTLADVEAAASHDDFVAYSAACTDWLAVPRLAATGATWRKVLKERTLVVNGHTQKVQYLAWDLSAGFSLALDVFQREGTNFRYATEVNADTGGFSGLAAAMAENASEPLAYHEYSSTWPDGSCSIGAASDGKPGNVAQCAALTPRPSPILAESSIRASAYCSGVDDAVARGSAAMLAVARCTAAREAESLVRLLQRNAKRFRPWTEYARLVGSDRIRLGREDGVKRGDVYIAESDGSNGDGRSLGFARVVQLGPGGRAGDGAPSRLKFKSGEAPAGTRMSEYALMGVRFGVRPGVLVLAAKGDLQTTLGYGGELSAGYDLTRHLPLLDEIWARVNLGYFKGVQNEGFLDVDLGLEAMSIVGGGVASLFGVGFSGLVAGSTFREPVSATEVSLSGGNLGAFARAGIEYSFGPDWSAELAAEARAGFSSATLKSEKSLMRVDGGRLVGGLALLSVGHTF
jgi:hypothetical protein